jgi:hypothetical protein
LAEVYIARKRPADAEPLLRQAADIQEQVSASSPRRIEILRRYQDVLLELDRKADASAVEQRIARLRFVPTDEAGSRSDK